MIVILAVLLLVAIILNVLPHIRMRKENAREYWGTIEFTLCMTVWIVFSAMTAAYIGMYTTSISRYADIAVFNEVQEIYSNASVDTLNASISIDIDIGTLGSFLDAGAGIDNLGNNKIAADRILEARDYRIQIITWKSYYRTAMGRWFLRMWIATPPPGLLGGESHDSQ